MPTTETPPTGENATSDEARSILRRSEGEPTACALPAPVRNLRFGTRRTRELLRLAREAATHWGWRKNI
jgi:hypothetical protein